MASLWGVTVDGLTLGFVYAVVAIGYTMVYGVLEFINFAHSEIFMVGAVIGAEVLSLLVKSGLQGAVPDLVLLIITLVLAMLSAGLLGVAIERIAYRPLRGSPRLVPLISAIGVSFFLQDAVRIAETIARGNYILGVPKLFEGQEIQLTSTVHLSMKSLLMMVAAVMMMAGLSFFVNKTKVGKAMRAVAQDPATASLLGINVNQIIMLTFFIGAALGGAAGTLFAVQYTTVNPYIGFVLGMKAFTAAVFGGIGNLPGAMVGGILLGLLESYGAAFLTVATNGVLKAEYKDVFAFVILILILVFKPSGLLGETVHEKV